MFNGSTLLDRFIEGPIVFKLCADGAAACLHEQAFSVQFRQCKTPEHYSEYAVFTDVLFADGSLTKEVVLGI